MATQPPRAGRRRRYPARSRRRARLSGGSAQEPLTPQPTMPAVFASGSGLRAWAETAAAAPVRSEVTAAVSRIVR